jgi:hypothetical protein
MASGIYGQVDLAAATYTTAFGPTVSAPGTYNIRFCNRNATACTVRLALAAAAGTPSSAEFIEFGTPIPAYGVLEEQGIPIQAGKYITAYSDSANVSVNVWGVD